MVRIVLCDGHPLYRAGLRRLLGAQPGYEIVAEADEAQAAREAALARRATLVVTELLLPDGDGAALVGELAAAGGGRVLVLTDCDDVEHVSRALAAGAAGYALKRDPSAATLEAVHAVSAGRFYLAPSLSPRLWGISRRDGAGVPRGGLGCLSPRERAVFERVVRGLSGKQIGGELGISARTVESHRYRIGRKLGVRSVPEMIRFAALHGLLPR